MNKHSIAFLFSGQGAQYVGMMQDIIHAYPESAACLSLADDVAGYSISHDIIHGPSEILNLTEHTQPALFSIEVAVLRILQLRNIFPVMAAGFSLGEWAALCAANVLDFESALRLVCLRARHMQKAVPAGIGSMAVILGQSDAEVESLCNRYHVFPSNYNCPGQISVAGYRANVDMLLEAAQREGIVAKELAISVPSHCPLMQPAADEMKKAVACSVFRDPSMPVVVNAFAQPITSAATLKKAIVEQLVMPVQFHKSVLYMLDAGIDCFIEIGPGKVLTGLVRKIAKAYNREVTTLRTDNMEQLQSCLSSLEA